MNESISRMQQIIDTIREPFIREIFTEETARAGADRDE
jgi:hypothetical protein